MKATRPEFYTDADLAQVTPQQAASWMSDALKAHTTGLLNSPSRLSQELSQGRVVYTVGELVGEWYGYRMYDTIPNGVNYQLVSVHDVRSGVPVAMCGGELIGPIRVGGIGAAALDVLAGPDTNVLAVVGTGMQAWHQVWAYSAVRSFDHVRVFSRDAGRRAEFAARVRRELQLPATASASASQCVSGADVVVLATNSTVPVVETVDLSSARFVSTVGPKQKGRQEFADDLLWKADRIVTDSLAQLEGYKPAHVAAGMQVEELSSSVGLSDIRQPDTAGLTVFLSVGLAGTEPFLVERLHRSRAASE